MAGQPNPYPGAGSYPLISGLVGLPAREIEDQPPTGVATVRVVMEDGWYGYSPSPEQPERLNLVVRKGLIEAAWRG